MKITYDAEAHAIYIDITEKGGISGSEELEDNIILDKTLEGIAGIELLGVFNPRIEITGVKDESKTNPVG